MPGRRPSRNPPAESETDLDWGEMVAITEYDLTSWWAPALAFAAGVVSCASPCVFPLVPGYVSFVSGTELRDDAQRPIVPILLFILGFAVVFTALGAFSSALVPAVKSRAGQIVSGAIIAVFGSLMLAYAFGLGGTFLFGERRPYLERARSGTVGALPLGMAFAAGWTPCIGPVLGGILGLAAIGGVGRGMFLLFVYSLGLVLPFLLIGLGLTRFLGAFDWVKRNYRLIAGVSGAALVTIGLLMASGYWTPWVERLARFAPGL